MLFFEFTNYSQQRDNYRRGSFWILLWTNFCYNWRRCN